MSFEDKLQQSIFNSPTEKSFIDKILAKADVDAIRELIKKSELTRDDLLQILYFLSSSESKLLNYSEWERYVILKLFVWIREFVKIAEQSYDYWDDLSSRENMCYKCRKKIEEKKEEKRCKCKKPEPYMVLTQRTNQLLKNVQRMIEHNIKFLVDLYLNISRTSLSVGGTGFLEILTNKYELSYPQQNNLSAPTQQPQGLLKLRR